MIGGADFDEAMEFREVLVALCIKSPLLVFGIPLVLTFDTPVKEDFWTRSSFVLSSARSCIGIGWRQLVRMYELEINNLQL